MSDCINISKCTFFDIEANDPSQRVALQGFMKLYCRGPKQDQCMRRHVGQSLGGPHKIPMNMMPNGHPLSGSDDSLWPHEVRTLLSKEREGMPQTASDSNHLPVKKKVVK